MKKEDKKHKKIYGGANYEHIIKNTASINISGSISDINTKYSALTLSTGDSDILGTTTIHGPIYSGTQPLTLATQAGILGVNALGENLLEMKINTVADARNFMVGVNNVASVFSENSGLLKSIESASIVALNHGRLMTEAVDRLNIPLVTKGIESDMVYSWDGRQMVKLSESVTTVLAYGQAVQNQFSILTDNEIVQNGVTVLGTGNITSGKTFDHIPAYKGSEAITSPFVFEPRTVKTKEVEKALPKVREELPVKTTEAIELMEYVFDQSTKNDDKIITTKVSELKKAIKSMQSSVAMFIQQTTQKVEITSIPTLHTIAEKSTTQTNKFPFKIPAGTTWKNIIIQFTDDNYVNIQLAGHLHPTGYADMGFVDKRTDKPTIQWGLLSLLAKGGGELPNSSSEVNDKYKKHKQILSDKLKDYFNIETDPFEPYKGGYKTKITLVPPPIKQSEPKKDYSVTDEIEEMFRDLTEE
jgi:hypothetical protein